MKVGYSEAAWRLFQSSLAVRLGRNGVLTWADVELAGTPFGRSVPLPVVRTRGDHGTRPAPQSQEEPSPEAGVLPGTAAGEPAKGPGIVPGTPDEKRDQGREPSGRRS